jgi:dimethylhistidine N-methyltransferase
MRPAIVSLMDELPAAEEFEAAMVDGLAATPKSVPPKFFYDALGSQLFDRITELDEYYPTRTELSILTQWRRQIARLAGPEAHLIEFGAGSLHKVRLLLDGFERPAAYTAIDVSREHLLGAAQSLARDYPGLPVTAVVADFTQDMALPATKGRPIGFFPGSTIGNLDPEQAFQFLVRSAGMLKGGALLIGVDLVKDETVLNAAYNDAKGVTAAFNRNLLVRANRELGADFRPDRFRHRAFFNHAASRIEMHLESLTAQQVNLAGRRFTFLAGETLHTENSYKWSIDGFRTLAGRAGFIPHTVMTDPDNLFSLHWLET